MSENPTMIAQKTAGGYSAFALISILALLAGAASLLCTTTSLEAAILPYNSEGRYWDGTVVYHAGSDLGWGITALGCWSATVVLIWWAIGSWGLRMRPEQRDLS